MQLLFQLDDTVTRYKQGIPVDVWPRYRQQECTCYSVSSIYWQIAPFPLVKRRLRKYGGHYNEFSTLRHYENL